jgi:hypothetical protein
MAKRFLMLVLVLASFAAVAPAAVVYGGYYGRPGVRVGVYAAPRYYYGPRVYAAPVVPYVAPAYPVYGAPYYGYGYGGYYRGGYYRGGYYRGGGYNRGYRR